MLCPTCGQNMKLKKIGVKMSHSGQNTLKPQRKGRITINHLDVKFGNGLLDQFFKSFNRS